MARRENARERNALNRDGHREDFRDNLFSIFVDNLNEKVDYECLWGLFKPFGKVRDIYLSAGKINRSSRFAFVRFGTLEEAAKVAEVTNGMHVYSWPISTKVASKGWKNRSVKQEEQRNNFEARKKQYKKEVQENGKQQGKFFQGNGTSYNNSYAEVVGGFRSGNKSNVEVNKDELLSMSWDFKENAQDWLHCCAVGVLKEFSSIDKVNHRLLDMKFEFSAAYLGDKSILWLFDSGVQRDRFLKDRVMWEDCFSSMVRWSESLMVQARLVWVNCWGVPMSCWSEDFFKKLGWQIGEPLMVDTKTVDRVHVDKGRLLVLISNHKRVDVKVNITGGYRQFTIKMEEDVQPVEIDWVERVLALRKIRLPVGRSSMPEKEVFQISWPREAGEYSQKPISQEGMVEGSGKLTSQVGKTASSAKKGRIRLGMKEFRGRGQNVNRVLDKGKKKRTYKIKRRLFSHVIRNGILNLEKKKGEVRAGESSSTESSSSDVTEGRKSCFLESLTERGSCSKEFFAEKGGLNSSRPKRVSFNLDSRPIRPMFVQSNICVDLGPWEESPTVGSVNERNDGTVVGQVSKLVERSSSDCEATKDELVRITMEAEMREGVMAGDFSNAREENVVLSCDNSEFREDLIQATIDEEMRRNCDRQADDSEDNVVLASLVAENNVIQFKGGANNSIHCVRLGSRAKSRGSSSHSMRTRNAKHREAEQSTIRAEADSVEAEVTNTLAIGAAIGFDFSEVEEAVLEEITRREEVDVARFAANSGCVPQLGDLTNFIH